VEIVDRNVFSALRGVPPPQPVEPAKAPPLPLLFGTMDLGSGRFALMAPGGPGPADSKQVTLGEDIGGYKLVSVNTSNVVVQWQDAKTTLEISTATRHAPGVPGVAEKTPNARAGQTTSVGSAPSSSRGNSAFYGRGASNSAARPSPPPAAPDIAVGAVVDGKRKVLVPGPFGMQVAWEDAGTPGSAAPNQTAAPNR
jgi:hypothetical protein